MRLRTADNRRRARASESDGVDREFTLYRDRRRFTPRVTVVRVDCHHLDEW